MNTKLKSKEKMTLRKTFFNLMNNAALGKTMGNVRKHRDVKLVTTIKEEIIYRQNLIIT